MVYQGTISMGKRWECGRDMKYIGKNGCEYLVYLYSEYRNTWKIEHIPFDGFMMEMSERSMKQFIKDNKLVRAD